MYSAQFDTAVMLGEAAEPKLVHFYGAASCFGEQVPLCSALVGGLLVGIHVGALVVGALFV